MLLPLTVVRELKSVKNEHYIQNEIRLWCGKHNIKAFRCNVGRVLTSDNIWFDTGLPNGFSDLIILPGNERIIFCECKTLKGKQREDQKRFEREMTAFGYKYILAHSLQEFIEKISVVI